MPLEYHKERIVTWDEQGLDLERGPANTYDPRTPLRDDLAKALAGFEVPPCSGERHCRSLSGIRADLSASGCSNTSTARFALCRANNILHLPSYVAARAAVQKASHPIRIRGVRRSWLCTLWVLPLTPFPASSYRITIHKIIAEGFGFSSRTPIRLAPLRPPLERRLRATALLACFHPWPLSTRRKRRSADKNQTRSSLDQPLCFHL